MENIFTRGVILLNHRSTDKREKIDSKQKIKERHEKMLKKPLVYVKLHLKINILSIVFYCQLVIYTAKTYYFLKYEIAFELKLQNIII